MTRKSWKVRPAESLADLLQRLVVRGFARFDDQVAHAELLDEGHDLLLRAGADRQHRDDRRDAEDHPHHRQQRAQLVGAQVVEAEAQFGQEVRGRAIRAGATDAVVTAVPTAVGHALIAALRRWQRRRAGRPAGA